MICTEEGVRRIQKSSYSRRVKKATESLCSIYAYGNLTFSWRLGGTTCVQAWAAKHGRLKGTRKGDTFQDGNDGFYLSPHLKHFQPCSFSQIFHVV